MRLGYAKSWHTGAGFFKRKQKSGRQDTGNAEKPCRAACFHRLCGRPTVPLGLRAFFWSTASESTPFFSRNARRRTGGYEWILKNHRGVKVLQPEHFSMPSSSRAKQHLCIGFEAAYFHGLAPWAHCPDGGYYGYAGIHFHDGKDAPGMRA